MRTILDILKDDHKKAKKLLEELTDTTIRAIKKRTELVDELERELSLHTTLEEEILYPAIRDAARNNEEREMVAEAKEEHRAVDEIILPDLKKTEVDTVMFGGRAKVLKELVEHHIEEEEDELFPLTKKLFPVERLQELGEQFTARKKELLGTRAA